jgi:hypothetical protein
MRKSLFYITLFLIISISSLYSVNKTGTTSAKFLSIGVGSTAAGMGGAFTSVANDATALYWNPAGIGYFKTRELYINHASWIADISFDYVAFTSPIGTRSAIGLSVTAVTMDEMDVTKYNNEDTGETFRAADYAFGLAFALNLTDRFSIGFNGKYIQQTIADSHAKGGAIDVGTMFKTPFGFRLGTTVSNFGPKLKMSGDDLLIAADVNQTIDGNNESVTSVLSTDYFNLPLVLRFGISDEIKIDPLLKILWSLDAVSPNDNSNYINAGMVLSTFKDALYLSAGANSLFLEDSPKEYSVGIGLRVSNKSTSQISVNFSFESLKYLGNTHQLGISLRY